MPYSIKDGQLVAPTQSDYTKPTLDKQIADAFMETRSRPLIIDTSFTHLSDSLNKVYDLVAQHDAAASFIFNNIAVCLVPVGPCQHANPTDRQKCNVSDLIRHPDLPITDPEQRGYYHLRFGNAVAIVADAKRHQHLITRHDSTTRNLYKLINSFKND